MSWKKVRKDVTRGPLGALKWLVIFVLALGVLFGGISFFSKPLGLARDRIAMKHSFQYKEGMEQRAATLQASIIEIDILIQQDPSNQGLQNQKRILTAQLRAITINK